MPGAESLFGDVAKQAGEGSRVLLLAESPLNGSLHNGDGKPVLPTHPPIQIAYMTDRLIRTAEGWQLTSRKFETWFEGGTPTTNPKL